MKTLLSLCFACFLLAGCKKEENSTPTERYDFVNYTGKLLTMDFYKTRSDYNLGQKLLKRILVDSAASIDLEPGVTYYLDWYSEDYLTSNWQNGKTEGETLPPYKFETESGVNVLNVSLPPDREDFSYNRVLLLSGSKSQQTWRANGFYPDFGTSDVWDQMPVWQKELTFTFKKDFSVECSYRDSTGKTFVAKSTMKIHYNRFRIQLTNDDYLKGEILAPANAVTTGVLEFHITEFNTRRGKYILVKAD
ncbi:MAG: hypothetical protein EOP49_02140 [Sphingobacteriales bacterium]|nr:MAG: hypothetical protein EOP49_02140 [Sphingobacteriales bacterium]